MWEGLFFGLFVGICIGIPLHKLWIDRQVRRSHSKNMIRSGVTGWEDLWRTIDNLAEHGLLDAKTVYSLVAHRPQRLPLATSGSPAHLVEWAKRETGLDSPTVMQLTPVKVPGKVLMQLTPTERAVIQELRRT